MTRVNADTIALDYVERIYEVRDEQSLIAETRIAVESLGFHWFAIARLPQRHSGADVELRVTDWPPGWHSRYVEAGYSEIDPIVRHARKTAHPYLWSEAHWDPQRDQRARDMMDDAKAHGLESGLVVPILAANGDLEAVSLACRGGSVPTTDRRAVQLIAIYAHHRARALSSCWDASPPARKCLQ
jgi:hypothetical protein